VAEPGDLGGCRPQEVGEEVAGARRRGGEGRGGSGGVWTWSARGGAAAAAGDLGGCLTPELGEEGEGHGCSISLAHSLKFFDVKAGARRHPVDIHRGAFTIRYAEYGLDNGSYFQ
jgi:hypothetical protein